jgi:hypothetical protein
MQNRTSPLTIAFYVVFALWFTAISYSFPSFYDWLLAPVVGRILVYGTIALFCTVVVFAAWRGFRISTWPRLDFTVLGCAVLGFDLVWRFYISQFSLESVKLISIAFDVATPAIAILGMFVVSSEWKRSGRVIKGEELFNG